MTIWSSQELLFFVFYLIFCFCSFLFVFIEDILVLSLYLSFCLFPTASPLHLVIAAIQASLVNLIYVPGSTHRDRPLSEPRPKGATVTLSINPSSIAHSALTSTSFPSLALAWGSQGLLLYFLCFLFCFPFLFCFFFVCFC